MAENNNNRNKSGQEQGQAKQPKGAQNKQAQQGQDADRQEQSRDPMSDKDLGQQGRTGAEAEPRDRVKQANQQGGAKIAGDDLEVADQEEMDEDEDEDEKVTQRNPAQSQDQGEEPKNK